MGRLILSNGVIHSDEDFELRSGSDANLRTRFRICSRNDQHTKIKSLSAHDVAIENSLCVKGDLTVLGTCTVQYCTLTSCTSAVQNNFVVTSTDAGASGAPDLKLYRDSASPADNDGLGNISFAGKNLGGSEISYAGINSTLTCAATNSERGSMDHFVRCDGVNLAITCVRYDGFHIKNNRALYLGGCSPLRNYGNCLLLTTGGGAYDVVIKPNDAEAGRIGANCTSKFGGTELGSWPANTEYAYFGHKALDHSQGCNYALLQQCSGRTFINSNTCVSFRICNSDKLRYTNTKFCSLLPSIFTSCVGIGTASPGVKLHTHTTGNNSIYITSSNNTSGAAKTALWFSHNFPSSGDWAGIIFDADDKLRITNSSSSTGNDIVIDSSNNVGISTSSPSAKLDLRGTGTDGGEVFRIESSGNVNDGGYHWMTSEIASGQTTDANIIHLIGRAESSKNSGYFGFNYQADAADCNFITLGGYAANHLLNITMGGKVGIGTTGPNKTLEVRYVSSSTDVTAEGLGGGTAGKGLLIYNNNQSNNYVYANLDFRARNADGRIAYQYQAATNVGDFHFITDNTNSPKTQMIIKNDGNVGIGTTTPGAKLHIKDSSNPPEIRFEDASGGTQTAKIVYDQTGQNSLVLSTQYQSASDENLIQFAPADNIAMTIRGGTGTSDGFVGIGTVTPGSRLHVYKQGTDSDVLICGAASGADARVLISGYESSELWLDRNGVGRWAFRRQTGTDDLYLYKQTDAYADNGVIQFWDYSSGNVGIGTTNPARKFDVRGGDINIDAGKRYLWSSGDAAILSCGYNMMLETYTGSALTEKVRIQGNGYVGIGTSCAWSPLQVHSSADQKILLSGSTNPYIRWQCGTSNRAYIQWIESGSIFGFFNSVGDNFDFFTHDTAGATNLRLKGSDGDIWGSFYAWEGTSPAHEVGILDADQNWAAKHVNDTCWEFLTNNQSRMFINSTGVYSASRFGFCYPSNCGPYFEAGGSYSAPSVFLKRHDGGTTETVFAAGVLCASTCLYTSCIKSANQCFSGNTNFYTDTTNRVHICTVNAMGSDGGGWQPNVAICTLNNGHSLVVKHCPTGHWAMGLETCGYGMSIYQNGGTSTCPGLRICRGGAVHVEATFNGCLCASTCVFSPIVCATTRFQSPIICGSTCVYSNCLFVNNAHADVCLSTPVVCSTFCVDSPQVNLTSDGLITFYGNNSSNHAIMNRDTGGNVADDIRINSYGAVHVNLDSNNNNTANAGFNIYRHGGGTGNLSDLLFAVDGEGCATHVFGDLCVTGSVIADGMVGDCLASQAVCTGTICFNTSCVTGYDAVYDVYVSSNPNCGGSTLYRDIVHMTVYVTTGWNGSAVTKYINHVNNFVRGNVHSSGGGSVTAVPKLLVGTTGCECYAAACATCLQIQVAGGSYKYDTCVKIKQVL